MPEARLPIITLTTDFGNADHFVGAVKGAILSVSTQLEIVDITHEIPAHDIAAAGWALRNAYNAFPRFTVHLAVTDPGVGSARRPIVAVTEGYAFVGPDNGIFSHVFEVEPPVRVVQITAAHYIRPTISPTFHARDIFGPVAAHLARGAEASNLGEIVEDYVRLELPRPKVTPEGAIRATVAHVDRFGNVVLNVTRTSMESFLERTKAAGFAAVVGSTRITRICTSYAEAPQGVPVLLYNSSNFLEIAANQGRASDLLGVRAGASVDLTLVQQASR
ncbi:MAG TPA: SAM-dependent chlorinase/fluorinase [Candidatus Polarisedimenticolia bacterium]|nr:SAM-dependent chlorinase/fluorinase [Candidatus Polarisedimenticolia bacterium]